MKIENEKQHLEARIKMDELSDSLELQKHNFGHAVLFATAYSVILTAAQLLASKSAGVSNFDESWPLLLGFLLVMTITSGGVVITLYRLGIRLIGMYPVGLWGLVICLMYWGFVLGLPIYIDLGVYYLVKNLFDAGSEQLANIAVGLSIGAYPVVQTLLLLYRLAKRKMLENAIEGFKANGGRFGGAPVASSLTK